MSDYSFSVEQVGDKWAVYLPHQCDEWNITWEDGRIAAPHDVAMRQLQEFVDDAQWALEALRERSEMGPRKRS